MSSSPQSSFEVSLLLYSYLSRKLKHTANLSILDIASGLGKNGPLLKVICREMNGECTVYGADIWKPYLNFCSKSIRSYDGLTLTDASHLPFQPVFDVILATEVLEHMNKQEGLLFLKNTEELLKDGGLIVISTPQGLQDQDELDGNKWQVHKSIWKKKELSQMGFQVFSSQQVLNTPLGKIFIPYRNMPERGLDKMKNFGLYIFGAFSVLNPSFSGKLIAYKTKI